MALDSDAKDLESQISQWRDFLLYRETIEPADVDELEDHLRNEVASLGRIGLSQDEAFLVAVKRIGNLDEMSKEFARVHADRLWKQLVLTTRPGEGASPESRRSFFSMLAYAVAAAIAIKIPAFFGLDFYEDTLYLRILGLLVLPVLAAYLAGKRRPARTHWLGLAVPFAVAAVLVSAYPFVPEGSTDILVVLHLPMVLWLVIGVAYLGADWRSSDRRMDFIRFTGEWFIYYVLIALGGGVLIGLTAGTFDALGFDPFFVVQYWILPCGAAGAVVVAAWLVEAKKSVIENMAPVLTRVFTPLFAVMFVASLIGLLVGGDGLNIGRDSLILFDLLLIAVVGLLLYAISARTSEERRPLMDVVQLVLVLSALVLDIVALAAILGRISEFGFTPNRTVGLGWNLVLLASLTWSAWLSIGVIRERRPMADLERWQTSYLAVIGLWAAIVVIVFPPVFAFA
ncbi:MAG TPA: hypothetical protein VIA81_06360 [Acidimicrobiia bacterium]